MSILPFPSFLDDIKEKGLRKAVLEGVDDVVERVTSGLNIQDLREALRGEAPSRRPNPRLQPHADGFWLHMRPSYFHRDMTGLYPTFRLGWLSTYFVFFETLTGIFLMIWYTPSPDAAYGNMLAILSNVPMGQLMRDLHRLGAEAMVLIVTLHMLRTFFTGSYKNPRQFTWFSGVILLLSTLLLSFSGYLLPWDQLALWAVTIGASMIEAAPPEVVGTNLNLLLRGGPDIGANGLLRFYLLHVLAVPAILFVFTGVHYYKVIIHGHSLPPQKENIGEDTAKRVPLDKRVYFIPDALTSEIMWIGVTTFIMTLLCVWFYHAPLEHHADPQVTPLGTTAPWYFLWIQGALKLGDKVLWGIVFPTVVFVGFMVMPYIDITPSRRYADRRFMISFGLLLMGLTTILSYMGLPEYGVDSTAENEIFYEVTHEPAHNKMGIILPVPFDQLVPGIYTTAQFEGSEDEVAEILAARNELIETTSWEATDDAGNRVEHTIAEVIQEDLRNTGNSISNLSFRAVPADAPELAEVMKEFNHLLDQRDVELLDGFGVVVITENQDNLRRIDVLIVWKTIEIEGGAPVLDENGEPVRVFDENGNQVWTVAERHLFIHRDSAYFMN